ncbi:glycosyltransferase family 4 protein [Chryseolinea sp. Jin1]|uniref:Glycosyltransferase family 4 protein n=2 Tax=Chryseolinea lacunae TaxID=2801331 RepID=A0ABS1KSI9_9BACT|nr:glycosyltransferase family 4 protein [Chryseolinea lacunae]
MKILFLIPYPLGESPSQRFRFEQYFDAIRARGATFETQSFWDLETWKILYKPGSGLQKSIGLLRGYGRRLKMIFLASNYDHIFIHRECAPLGPPIFEWLLAKVLHKKIIYDFDDSIWLPDAPSGGLVNLLKWHRKVKAICRWSHTVSCGNAYLADYARQFNNRVVVNPTTIDTEALHNPVLYKTLPHPEEVVIGWTGTHSTLKYLDPLLPVLQTVEQKYGSRIRFLVIANKPPTLPLQRLQFVPWQKETEIEDLLRLDIGIMPLTDDLWAKGKCGFKALQYMALGIPAVVSPVGVNAEMVDASVGYTAATATEWEKALEALLDDDTLRHRLGKKGRQKVVDQYSVSSNTSTFLSLFEK